MSMAAQNTLSNSDLLFRISSLEDSLTDIVVQTKQLKYEIMKLLLEGVDVCDMETMSPDAQAFIQQHEDEEQQH